MVLTSSFSFPILIPFANHPVWADADQYAAERDEEENEKDENENASDGTEANVD